MIVSSPQKASLLEGGACVTWQHRRLLWRELWRVAKGEIAISKKKRRKMDIDWEWGGYTSLWREGGSCIVQSQLLHDCRLEKKIPVGQWYYSSVIVPVSQWGFISCHLIWTFVFIFGNDWQNVICTLTPFPVLAHLTVLLFDATVCHHCNYFTLPYSVDKLRLRIVSKSDFRPG